MPHLVRAFAAGLQDRLGDAIRASDKGSQRALAEALGISEGAVSKWISQGSGVLGWQRLRDVCLVLNVSSDVLLGLSPQPPREAFPDIVRRLSSLVEDMAEKIASLQSETERLKKEVEESRLLEVR